MKLAVLMACHNRRRKSLDCLESLFAQEGIGDVKLEVWLVDDGSTDGTTAAVNERFPSVHVIAGDGKLFWCGGMRLAWDSAAATNPDAYLWLNDDVTLLPGALKNLLDVSEQHPAAIVIGSCRCPETGDHVYGGQLRPGRHPGRVTPVAATAGVQECDTFQGNLVLVPAEVFARVGNMVSYSHAMADTAYGYEARKKGFRILIAPGYGGTCPPNPGDCAWRNRSLPLRERLKKLTSLKGLPPRDWFRFCFRHGGMMAPVYFAAPYLRAVLNR